ncbi:forkhead box protein p4 [Lasius niger]|uniref:Forkhead box protein p4 n=1 Tax=Lasius niger TaxID=67767 RepID=A0A0J7KIV4_LASNI|nr:forkhead box protein p4 [Lasius niger]
MSQPPPNFGVSQVSPVSMSALVSAVRSPGGGQLPPSAGGAPIPPLPTIPNMTGLPPMPNMPGSMPSMAGPIRRRISDKSALSLAGGKIVFPSLNLQWCRLRGEIRVNVFE